MCPMNSNQATDQLVDDGIRPVVQCEYESKQGVP